MALVKSCLILASTVVAFVFVGCQKNPTGVSDIQSTESLAETGQSANHSESGLENRQTGYIAPQTVAVSGLFVSSPANLSQSDPNAMSIDSSPERVLKEFLTLLRQGDRFAAQRLLTELAQQQTVRANLELDAPGDEDTDVTILSTRYATNEQVMAEVDCLFHRGDNPGESIKISWMMRRQANGWKVYGMLINLADGTLDLISFENATDLARIQDSVEAPSGDRVAPPKQQASSDPAALRYR